MTAAQWVIGMLIVLAVQSAHAAEFDVGAAAYSRGDFEAAFAEWEVLAEEGDPRAQYELARMLSAGIGTAKNERAAIRWFRQAGEQGYTEAQLELALMYSLGRGVRRDDSAVAYWYGRLAEAGHVTAQVLLADMYETGTGVDEDPSRAAYWYQRAAEQGHVGAQVKLGDMHAQGRGVAEDPVKAWAWYDLAAARGDQTAAAERTRLRPQLDEEAFARAMALRRELSPLPVPAPVDDDIEPDVERAFARAFEMLPVKSGCFAMGSDPNEPGRYENENRHAVCVSEFSISRYEVTRGQYAAFIAETGRETPDGCQTYSEEDGGWMFHTERSWRNPGYAQTDDHPVVCVSREDAQAFAEWLSQRQGVEYRLPTEAEWEYTARAGRGTSRYWGNDPDNACLWANVGDRTLHRHYSEWLWTFHPCDDGYVYTAPVGSFSESPYGLHDILGNVWEWTCSSYDVAYEGAERACAPSARNGVMRGGAWSNSPDWARAASRFGTAVDARFDLAGFRLAHD